MKAIKRLIPLTCLVLLLAWLIGCVPPAPSPTPSATPTPSAKPSPTPGGSPTPTSSPTPSPTAAQPKYGGILQTWSTVTPSGFDPHRKISYVPFFAMPVFQNLVQFDPTKVDFGSTATIIGDLAQKWDISADGTVYTFYLVQGVKWHDGSAFTADDVVYSLNKMVDPKQSSLVDDLAAFDHVVKVDDYTVKIYLKYPSASFLAQLGGPYAPIEAKSTANVDYKSAAFLMGTGPFMYKSYTSGVSLSLVRNPNYWKKDAQGKALPYLDGINVQIIADASAAVDAMVTKRVDGQASFALINQDLVDRAAKQAPTLNLFTFSSPGIGMLTLNTKTAAFQDVRVRQALRLMVDKVSMGVAAYGSPTWADPTRTIFTSAYGLPVAEMNKIVGYDQPVDARTTQAKKLMADAGYANGFTIRVVVRNLVTMSNSLQYYADQLKRNLNVTLNIDSLDVNAARVKHDQGDFDMYMDNPLISLGDPDEFRSYFETTGVNNSTHMGSAAQDALWAAQSKELDPAKRITDTQQIERLALADAWFFNTGATVYYSAWWPYVKGIYNQKAIYTQKLRYETVWLDK